jgi:predicted nucleic-acid-binding protein
LKIVADSNVLLRGIVRDDARQLAIAHETLGSAQLVAVSTASLCEVVWVLRRYKHARSTIADTIRALINSANVACDRPAVDAGLAALDAGGDFADGVIAHEGRVLGADTFVSFDKRAVAQISQTGQVARLLE